MTKMHGSKFDEDERPTVQTGALLSEKYRSPHQNGLSQYQYEQQWCDRKANRQCQNKMKVTFDF
jgi:hypothetical protein